MTPVETAALQESAKTAKGFLGKIFGPALDEVGLIIQDNIKLKRLKNQIRNLEKVRSIVEKEDISIKQVDLKVIVPYLDNVSLEEDESLQDAWANLFTNYIDSDINLLSTVYPSILSQISSLDLQILEHMSTLTGELQLYRPVSIGGHDISYYHLSNLIRLGLVEEVKSYTTKNSSSWHEIPEYLPVIQNDDGNYIITSFGSDFLDACRRN